MKTKKARFPQKIWIGIGIGVLVLIFGLTFNQGKFLKGSIRRSADDTFQSLCRSLWGDFDPSENTCRYVDTTYNDIDSLEQRHNAFGAFCESNNNFGAVWHEDASECEWRGFRYGSEGWFMSQLNDFKRVCTDVYSLEWHDEDRTCEMDGVHYTSDELGRLPVIQFQTFCTVKKSFGFGTEWHSENRTCEYKNIAYDNEATLRDAFQELGALRELCSQIVNAQWMPAVPAGMPDHCVWGPSSARYFSKVELETAIQALHAQCDQTQNTGLNATQSAAWDDSEKKCVFDGQDYYNAHDLEKQATIEPLKRLCESTEGAEWNTADFCNYNGMTYDQVSILQQVLDLDRTHDICVQIKNAVWHNRNGCEWGGNTVSSPNNLLKNISDIQQECAATEGAQWMDDEKKCAYEGRDYYNNNSLHDVAYVVTLRTVCDRAGGEMNESNQECSTFDLGFGGSSSRYTIDDLRAVGQNLDFINFCRSLSAGTWDFENSNCILDGIESFSSIASLQNYFADLKNICESVAGTLWNDAGKYCQVQSTGDGFSRKTSLKEAIEELPPAAEQNVQHNAEAENPPDVAALQQQPEQPDIPARAEEVALEAEAGGGEVVVREDAAVPAAPAQGEAATSPVSVPASNVVSAAPESTPAPAPEPSAPVPSAGGGGGGGGGGGFFAPVRTAPVVAKQETPTIQGLIKGLESKIKEVRTKIAKSKSKKERKVFQKELSGLEKQLKDANKKLTAEAKIHKAATKKSPAKAKKIAAKVKTKTKTKKTTLRGALDSGASGVVLSPYQIVVIAISFFIVFLFALFIQWRDKRSETSQKQVESFSVLMSVFFWGVAMTFLLKMSLDLVYFYFPHTNDSQWFFIASIFLEELAKIAALIVGLGVAGKLFNELSDGVIYTAFAALGFLFLENIIYVLQFATDAQSFAEIFIGRNIFTLGLHFFTMVFGVHYAFAYLYATHGAGKVPVKPWQILKHLEILWKQFGWLFFFWLPVAPFITLWKFFSKGLKLLTIPELLWSGLLLSFYLHLAYDFVIGYQFASVWLGKLVQGITFLGIIVFLWVIFQYFPKLDVAVKDVKEIKTRAYGEKT